MPAALTLAASLVRLAKAVGELRQAQQHAAQAAAARKAAEGLYAALSGARAGVAALKPASQARQAQTVPKPGDAARLDFPFLPGGGPLVAGRGGRAAQESPNRSRPTSSPPSRAGPGR
jgi:hypothetical protein